MNINWEQLRKEEWPVLETMTFLDAACVSFAPQRTVRALKDFADFTARQDEENSSAHHIAMDAKRHKALSLIHICVLQVRRQTPRSRWPEAGKESLGKYRRSA